MRRDAHTGPRLYRAALLAPFGRLLESPTWSKLTGLAAAAAEWLVGAPFVHLLLLLTAVSFLDYLVGAEVARRDGRYDPDIARAGAIGKLTGVLLALIIWLTEAVAANAGVVDTHGMLATALAIVLLTVELESFDRHRERLTGRPTPLIRPILDFLRRMAEGAFPGAPKDDR